MANTISNGSRIWRYAGTPLDLVTCAQAMRCIKWPLKSVYHYLPNYIVWLDASAKPAGTQVLPVDTDPKPDRNKNRHRPGYFTEYMRQYRARKKASAEGRDE